MHAKQGHARAPQLAAAERSQRRQPAASLRPVPRWHVRSPHQPAGLGQQNSGRQPCRHPLKPAGRPRCYRLCTIPASWTAGHKAIWRASGRRSGLPRRRRASICAASPCGHMRWVALLAALLAALSGCAARPCGVKPPGEAWAHHTGGAWGVGQMPAAPPPPATALCHFTLRPSLPCRRACPGPGWRPG